MIVQASGINARINRLAHSFCSKPLAEINEIFHREVEKEREWARRGMKVPDREWENEKRLGGNWENKTLWLRADIPSNSGQM